MAHKSFIITITSIIIFAILSACGKFCESNQHLASGRVVGHTSCKAQKTMDLTETEISDTLSCIRYAFDKSSGILSVIHENAGFNCCPGYLHCQTKLNGDTLIIEEYEKEAACRCLCLYDMEIEIRGMKAKKYLVKIVEPYLHDQPGLVFRIDLAFEPTGRHCVVRKQYPWRI